MFTYKIKFKIWARSYLSDRSVVCFVRIPRRKLLKLTSIVLGTSALAGCSGDSQDGDDTPAATPTDRRTPTETPAPTETPTEQPEPAFELTDLRTQSTLLESGQEVTAAATFENVGSGAGETTVTFTLDVSETTVESDTVEPGDATQVTATVDVPLTDADRYPLAVELGNGKSISTPVDIFEDLSSAGLYGTILSPTDVPLSDSTIRLISTDQGKEFVDNDVIVGGREQFNSPQLRTELNYNVSVTFHKEPAMYGKPNGIPAILGLERNHSVSSEAEVLDQYSIPQSYQTQIQLVDSAGEPIPDFNPITVRDGIGNGIIAFATDSEGYLIGPEAAEAGITLPPQGQSNITLDARPASGGRPDRFGTVYGSGEGEEFTIEISNPGQYRG